jgi:hypothetical protein
MNVTRTILLPIELCEAAEKRFSGRFGSVEGLLTAVLKELLRDGALELDKQEQEIIEARLKALGYV